MTVDPADLAALHALCFKTPRPWNAREFANLLADQSTLFIGDHQGFVLGRVIMDQVDLLTIAVSPARRRTGIARILLSDFEILAKRRGGATCFLDVAANNQAAIALYSGHGYSESGRRKGYYVTNSTTSTDAILFSKPLLAP